MKLECNQGHLYASVGRTSQGRCRQCVRESTSRRRRAAREKACRKKHPFDDCQRYTDSRGADRCRTREHQVGRDNQRLARERMTAFLDGPDSWEDEFGPVPDPDPEMTDWVAVLRRSEKAAESLPEKSWAETPPKRPTDRPGRLRSSIEGRVGSPLQRSGKTAIRVDRRSLLR